MHSKIKNIKMRELELEELTEREMYSVKGGSEFFDWLCYWAGRAFSTLGIMATRGAAGYEIMGSK